ILGTKTIDIAEDDFTVTLYVKDAVGNLNSSGQAFSLIDVLAPSCYIISPANDSEAILSETIDIVVYADDASGIDTTRFDIYFFSLSTSYYYLYQESVMHQANYDIYNKTWTLEFNSVVLPNDNYTLVTQVYDFSENANGNSSVPHVILVDNDVLNVYGVYSLIIQDFADGIRALQPDSLGYTLNVPTILSRIDIICKSVLRRFFNK
ncbi:MAG: hypothetical protein ACTSQF_08930, partial [Candidatus Heimdallarchaeaceae archaeon]